MSKTIIQTVFVLFLLTLHIIFLIIVLKKKQKKICPGTLDLTYGQCTDDGKHYISFIKRRNSCDPSIVEIQQKNTILFGGKLALQYVMDRQKYDPIYDIFQNENVAIFKGIFYFLLKPFLTILPSDFGQNYITPYGTPSFLADYISCLPDPSIVCRDLTKNGDEKQIAVCSRYFDQLNQIFANHENSLCSIPNPELFNNLIYVELGLLGAMTIKPSQAIIISGIIPKNIGLKYWSFTAYLADRYRSSNKCNPFHNIYFSSLLDPFNNFSYISNEDIEFVLIISINPHVGNKVSAILSNEIPNAYIHRFNLPSGSDTMIIEKGLLNPNQLTENDRAFDYETDRLAVLFRMNVLNPDNPDFLKFKFNPNFSTHCIDFGETLPMQLYDGIHPILKTPFPTKTDEVNLLKAEMESIHETIKNSYQKQMKDIHCFDSLLGTFAPLDEKVYYNHYTYKNGRQAIQMASNANGDNPDAWYKLSQPQCMSDDDVMFCLCVNHTALQNSIYCNINVLDKQLGRGITSFEIFEDDSKLLSYPFYGVAISRNAELLAEFKAFIQQMFPTKIYLYDFYIETGLGMNWNVPKCHQLLFIERTYLNPMIPDENGNLEYYKNVQDDTLWNQMTRPDGKSLLNPMIFKFSRKKPLFVFPIIVMIIIIILFAWKYSIIQK